MVSPFNPHHAPLLSSTSPAQLFLRTTVRPCAFRLFAWGRSFFVTHLFAVVVNPSLSVPPHLFFLGGAAGLDGGGIFSLSTGVEIVNAVVEGNTADRNGAGVALDCAAEICVGELPRDTCDVIAANLTATALVRNTATYGDGGGIHVFNRGLAVAAAESAFVNNSASRGAAVFGAAGGSVTVDGLSGNSARAALVSTLGAGSNDAAAYGAVLASPPSSLEWVDPPAGGVVMPGDNLCGDEGGCVVTMGDDYGNVPTTPTVVNVAVSGAILNGPQFVLVAGGFSETIPDLSVRLVGEPGALPLANVSAAVALQFVDGDEDHNAVALTVTQCDRGFGMVMTGDSVWCQSCEAGYFSDGVDWAACEPCAVGYATEPGTTGAVVCDWCEPGFGWNDDGSCVTCAVGTFSGGVSFKIGCDPCDSGLTTSGDGASACAIAVASVATPATPWWVWVAIGVAVLIVVAIVGIVAWRSSRRKVISHYYIGTSLSS